MRSQRIRLFLPGLVLLALSACNFPARDQTLATPPEAAYTAAAQTIVAQLTQVASPEPEQSTREPGLTPSPETITPTLPQASPTGTPQASPSATPSPTIAITVIPSTAVNPAPRDIRQDLGNPDWQDTFENADNWSLYEDDHVRFRINNDRLIMVALNADGRDSWMLSWPNPTRFYLELTATTDSCTGLDRYGILFRSDAEVGYLFGLSCDGQYSLRSWDGDAFQTLLNWTPSEQAIAGSGQTNRLGVRLDGDDILLYINGVHQATVQDSAFDEDSFGVFVGSRNTPNFRVELSEIAYWELE